MENHFYNITAPLSVTIFITHVRILRNGSYAIVSVVFMPRDFNTLLCPTHKSFHVIANSLDQDQVRHSVGLSWIPKCLTLMGFLKDK